MKKTLLSLLAIILCLSFTQCKSNEDKANELIKDYMFKTLYDFESYQPIETKIDSAFHTPYNDSVIENYAIYALVLDQKLDELDEEYEDAKHDVDIWSDYYSDYGRNKYINALDEAMSILHQKRKVLSLLFMYEDSIYQLIPSIENEFIGWQVSHDFRCKTKGGQPDLGHIVFTMDKNFKNILSNKDTEDKDYKKINDIIKNCIELTENEHNTMLEIIQEESENL